MTCETWIDIIDLYRMAWFGSMIILAFISLYNIIYDCDLNNKEPKRALNPIKWTLIAICIGSLCAVAIDTRYKGMFFCTYEEAYAYEARHWSKKGKTDE